MPQEHPLNLSYKYIPFLKITDDHRNHNGCIYVNYGAREVNDNGIIFRLERFHGGSTLRSTAKLNSPQNEGLFYTPVLFEELPLSEQEYCIGNQDV